MTTNVKDLLLSINDKPVVIYPAYIRITGDYAIAAALAQVLYWHKAMNGKKFYKTDADFASELLLTDKQFERVKKHLKSYDFLIIKAQGIPAKTFYDVDYEKLAIALVGEKSVFPPTDSSFPQKVESEPPEKEKNLPSQKVETNTENTQRIKQNNNSTVSTCELSSVVVVELEKTFSSEELPASKKIIASIPQDHQLEVLAVLVAMLKTAKVTNKLGYLRGIINSVQDGTFTPLPAQVKPITAEERIKQEKRKQLEAEKRGKVDNVGFFVELYKKCGSVAAIPAQYLQAVKEQLSLQGIALNGC